MILSIFFSNFSILVEQLVDYETTDINRDYFWNIFFL